MIGCGRPTTGHLRHRRGRPAPRHGLRPRGPRLRDGRSASRANLTGGDADLHRADMSDEAQADGRRRGELRRPVRRAAARARVAVRSKIRSRGVYKKLLFRPTARARRGHPCRRRRRLRHACLAAQERRAADRPARRAWSRTAEARRCGVERAARQRRRSARATTSAKGGSVLAIRDDEIDTVAQSQGGHARPARLRRLRPAGDELLQAELKAAGRKVNNTLVRAFRLTPGRNCSRSSRSSSIRTFGDTDGRPRPRARMRDLQTGRGFHLRQPLERRTSSPSHQPTLQDTNDRFLANIQRGGSYSVVPRIPGGEITPEKLIVIGEIAKKYGLYTKITGGQRIDMFGAPVAPVARHLGRAGRRRLRERTRLRQGHADGQELRRHDLVPLRRAGLGRVRRSRRDSAIEGIRAPHKLKAAVRGCVRECAEAQSKDFGADRHRKGLEPLCLRQRRRQAAACRPAGRRPRRGNGPPLHRPLPDVSTSRPPTG